MRKTTLSLLIVLMSIFFMSLFAIGIYFYHSSTKPVQPPFSLTGGVWLETPAEFPPFSFLDDTHHTFTEKNFKGHWTLLFFGYTRCQHVCPATMQVLKAAYATWETRLPKNQLPQVLMISIDPERDSTLDMHQYVKSFNPDFIGIHANSKQTLALENELNVYADKVPADDGNAMHYKITHTPELFIIDPAGNIRGYFNFPESIEDVTDGYLNILRLAGSQI
jgi:protein SCO1